MIVLVTHGWENYLLVGLLKLMLVEEKVRFPVFTRGIMPVSLAPSRRGEKAFIV